MPKNTSETNFEYVFTPGNPPPPPPVAWRTGHCKNLKGDWEKSASALKGVVGVAAVDATESKALASKYGIQVRTKCPPGGNCCSWAGPYQDCSLVSLLTSGGPAFVFLCQGFPSIKVFGADKRNPTDYKGERSATAIVTGGMAAARELVKSRQGGGAKKKTAGKDKKADGGSKGPSPA